MDAFSRPDATTATLLAFLSRWQQLAAATGLTLDVFSDEAKLFQSLAAALGSQAEAMSCPWLALSERMVRETILKHLPILRHHTHLMTWALQHGMPYRLPVGTQVMDAKYTGLEETRLNGIPYIIAPDGAIFSWAKVDRKRLPAAEEIDVLREDLYELKQERARAVAELHHAREREAQPTNVVEYLGNLLPDPVPSVTEARAELRRLDQRIQQVSDKIAKVESSSSSSSSSGGGAGQRAMGSRYTTSSGGAVGGAGAGAGNGAKYLAHAAHLALAQDGDADLPLTQRLAVKHGVDARGAGSSSSSRHAQRKRGGRYSADDEDEDEDEEGGGGGIGGVEPADASFIWRVLHGRLPGKTSTQLKELQRNVAKTGTYLDASGSVIYGKAFLDACARRRREQAAAAAREARLQAATSSSKGRAKNKTSSKSKSKGGGRGGTKQKASASAAASPAPSTGKKRGRPRKAKAAASSDSDEEDVRTSRADEQDETEDEQEEEESSSSDAEDEEVDDHRATVRRGGMHAKEAQRVAKATLKQRQAEMQEQAASSSAASGSPDSVLSPIGPAYDDGGRMDTNELFEAFLEQEAGNIERGTTAAAAAAARSRSLGGASARSGAAAPDDDEKYSDYDEDTVKEGDSEDEEEEEVVVAPPSKRRRTAAAVAEGAAAAASPARTSSGATAKRLHTADLTEVRSGPVRGKGRRGGGVSGRGRGGSGRGRR